MGIKNNKDIEMEGYINEGGQLKTKNGQKYVVNQSAAGYYITKKLLFVLLLLATMVLIAVALITYYIAAQTPSCQAVEVQHGRPTETISSAGMLGAAASAPTVSDVQPAVNDVAIDDGAAIQSEEFFLNDGWTPSLYKLLIEPNFENGTSNGTVWIDVQRDPGHKENEPIVLDINNITIFDVQVFIKGIDMIKLEVEAAYGAQLDTFIIDFRNPEKVPVHANTTYQIRLSFISRLADTLQGFYRSDYEDDGIGHEKISTRLVSTQFSPIDARRAFPCFDRPDKKAEFEISIIRPQDKSMTLSNMPSSYVSIARAGYIMEDFEKTPKMSTYLVAFIVSDLVNTNVSTYISSPQLNIWSRRHVSNMTKYAHEVASQVLPYLQNYFGIEFNLPKIDMVALPDFGFSAMENWGLITFRESALLVPDDNIHSSSAEHSERVATVIAHELAHQWFGNLVTMKWWDDLWLKEGFATYLSYLAVNHIEPYWHVMDLFPINEMQKAMLKDSDRSSHPISFNVTNPTDIRRIFDPISYSKGAAIIRMMNSFLGEEAFRQALTAFLKRFSYSNAVHDDLFEIMTTFGHQFKTLPSHVTVKQIMDTWLLQPGYPVLNVERIESDVKISQQRYMLPVTDKLDDTRWYIPVTVVTNNTNERMYWFSNKDASITVAGDANKNNSLYLNVNRTGYYRVNYDYTTWSQLSNEFHNLPSLIRSQLIDDSLNLARNELLTYDIPLTFLVRMGHKFNDIETWAAAETSINFLNTMLAKEPAYEHYRAFMKSTLRPAFDNYGFDNSIDDSHAMMLHRVRIIKHMCFFGYDRCTNRAQVIYRQWVTNQETNKINPNLKEAVYCTALREDASQVWYFTYKQYLETSNASEKEVILSALGCSNKPWLLSKYLNMTISEKSGIKKQDGARAFSAVAKNPVGNELAFDFLMTNIKEISEYFGDGFSTLSKMIDAVTTYMNKPHHKDQLDRLAAKCKLLGLVSVERSIHLATEQVKNNIHWRANSYYQLQYYLESIVDHMKINLRN